MTVARGHEARASRGFLLLETLAALVLFGIVLAGLTPLLAVTIRGVAHGRRETAATVLARDKVEDIRSTAYTAVISGADVVTDSTTRTTYNRTWTASAGPTTTSKAMTVTVQWTDQRAHSLALATIVAQ
jgi:Tfp pilus assembly protein PilV